jgi:hypothetical protein
MPGDLLAKIKKKILERNKEALKILGDRLERAPTREESESLTAALHNELSEERKNHLEQLVALREELKKKHMQVLVEDLCRPDIHSINVEALESSHLKRLIDETEDPISCLREELSSDDNQQQAPIHREIGFKPIRKGERQDQKDREAVQAWARERLEQTQDALPTLVDIAQIAKEELDAAKNYDLRTLQDWIRPVHPQYTPGKPGRKKKSK